MHLHDKGLLLKLSMAWRDWLVFIFLLRDAEQQQGFVIADFEVKLSRLQTICAKVHDIELRQVQRAFERQFWNSIRLARVSCLLFFEVYFLDL